MKILGMGVPELVIILVVVLLIFGPKNLPKLGSALGKSIKGMREGMNSNYDEDGEGTEVVETTEEPVVEKVEKLEAAETQGKKTVRRVVKKKAEPLVSESE